MGRPEMKSERNSHLEEVSLSGHPKLLIYFT